MQRKSFTEREGRKPMYKDGKIICDTCGEVYDFPCELVFYDSERVMRCPVCRSLIETAETMPDSYISEDLPPSKMPKRRTELFQKTYGADMKRQPLCQTCGRPKYYRMNIRTGEKELFCTYCG